MIKREKNRKDKRQIRLCPIYNVAEKNTKQ